MPDPVPPMDRERSLLYVIGGAFAMHALISSGRAGEMPAPILAAAALDIAEAFVAEAEKRYGKIPT